MAWVKAKNGNVIEVTDEALAKRFSAQGHEVSETDPRLAKQKPKTKK